MFARLGWDVIHPRNGDLGVDMPVTPRQDGERRPLRQAAVVLPLRPRTAGGGPSAPSDAPRPVTRLPVPGAASPYAFGRAAQQGLRHEFEDTLTCVTDGIFRAGLALQTALDQPADGLRLAAEHALDLLDETVREMRDAAFAGHRRAADGVDSTDRLDNTGAPGAGQREPARAVRDARRDAKGPCDREALRARARSTRVRAREARTRSRELAVLSAATQDQVAAVLSRLASRDPRQSAGLRELSQAAADHASRLRQWVHDHAATG